MNKRPRYDGLGIAMLGLAALMLSGLAMAGFIRAPAAVDDTGVQQSMAWASWAMVGVSLAAGIIGALSLYLIFRTLGAAQRSAIAAERTLDETRLIGRAQTRAYLAATSFALKDDDLLDTIVTFTLRNAGQSPALAIQVEATLEARWGGLAQRSEKQIRRISALAAGGDVEVTVFYSNDFKLKDMLEVPGDSLGDHFVLFSLDLVVSYLDVFSDESVHTAFLQAYAARGHPPPYKYLLIEHL